jgi:phosphopantothenoylcysteine decarboxylase/phosphopantothenate--cysteine ligase
MSKGKILFKISGSIATFKSAALVSKLVHADYEVEIVMSKSALEFVGRATFEGLTGRRVHADTFESGSYMSHIHLDKWADLVVLCPATANTINKLASGIGDDLLTTLFLAHDFAKPYLLAPAMNTRMYLHPATQQSIQTLRSWGVTVLEADSGVLACGDTGAGRLLEPDTLFATIELAIGQKHQASAAAQSSRSSTPQMKVLITSGATSEPIDGIRSITNFSSGRTGAKIAEQFLARGHLVTLLHAAGAAQPVLGSTTVVSALTKREFVTFQDLDTELNDLLGQAKYDAVIHLAAVGDYSVASVKQTGSSAAADRNAKIASGLPLTLELKPNPKLVNQLREMSKNKTILIAAFKLTHSKHLDARLQAVNRLADAARPDWIVLNDYSEVVAGVKHVCKFFQASPLQELFQCANKQELAEGLEQTISQGFAKQLLNRKEKP